MFILKKKISNIIFFFTGFINKYHKNEYHKFLKFFNIGDENGEFHKYGHSNRNHDSHQSSSGADDFKKEDKQISLMEKLKLYVS